MYLAARAAWREACTLPSPPPPPPVLATAGAGAGARAWLLAAEKDDEEGGALPSSGESTFFSFAPVCDRHRVTSNNADQVRCVCAV